jgi:hypothetical protein
MANEVEIVLKATDQATATLKGFGANVKGSFTELASVIGLAGKAFGAVKGVIDDTVGYTMELAKQVRTLSRDIGATPEEASKLIEVAGDMEVSFGSLETALKGAIRKGFDPTVEGLGKISDAYLKLQPGVERTKFLMDTFGRSGADVARLMELGSAKITEYGDALDGTAKIMDGAALQAAEDYRLEIEGMNDSVENLKLSIGKGLIPVLGNLLGKMSTGNTVVDLYNKAIKEGAINVHEFNFAAGQEAEAIAYLNDKIKTHTTEVENLTRGEDSLTARMNLTNEATKTLGESSLGLTETFKSASDAIAQYSVQLLYSKATQDLSYESALLVGRALGLVDESAVLASIALATLRANFDSGKLSAADYARAVANLNNTIQNLKDKQISIDIYYNKHMENEGGSGYPYGKASGGPVMAGSPYIVGEAGPELFVPNQSGQIIPNNQVNNKITNINVSPHYYRGSEPSLMDELAIIGAFSRA